jgi:hypothetical protein
MERRWSEPREVRVVVLSDTLLYREGLAALLAQIPTLRVTNLVSDPWRTPSSVARPVRWAACGGV